MNDSHALAPTPALCPTSDERGLGGLLALVEGRERPLPLVSVRVRVEIAGALARTVVEQRFANRNEGPVEAVHLFPLPVRGALTEVELRCGELVVRAECREKDAAEREFAAARTAGHRAALVTRERPDVHTLRVTNLPPGEEVVVRLVVIEALAAEDGALRFRFPTTIAPRYIPGNEVGHVGPGTAADTDRVPDASRISPPLRLAGGTRLDLEVRFVGAPSRLQSSLHALRVDLADGVVVAPSGTATCDRDFVLAFAFAGAQGGARAWTDGETTLLLVEPPAVAATPLPRDAVFCVDISGSMDGTKMRAAKLALRTALRGLLPGDRFRVIAFDDRVEPHAPDFVPFSSAALAVAERFVGKLDARGGTEMLPPIRAALDGDRPEGRLRTVLFITDGQAGNEAELVAAVANRARGARFFSLGIDTAVNESLLTQLARMGGGACTLCTPDDDIEAVVARIEARFGAPVADGLRVAGDEARPEARTLFAGQAAALFVRGAGPVTATASSAAGLLTWTATPERSPVPLGALWARERVEWLEDRLTLRPFEEEALRPEIVRVALAAGIASRFTAFVAVERTRIVGGTLTEVVQPVEVPHQWEGFAAQGGGMPVPPPMAMAAPGGAPMRSYAMPAPAAPPPMAKKMKASAPVMADADEIDAMSGPTAAAPRGGAVASAASRLGRAFGFGGRDSAKEAAPRPRPEAAAPVEAPSPDVAATALAQTQDSDGSWGQDVPRTVAALLTLLRAGNTRVGGLRKRAVLKAATWLAGHAAVPEVAAVLALLEAVERGEPLVVPAELARFG